MEGDEIVKVCVEVDKVMMQGEGFGEGAVPIPQREKIFKFWNLFCVFWCILGNKL